MCVYECMCVTVGLDLGLLWSIVIKIIFFKKKDNRNNFIFREFCE